MIDIVTVVFESELPVLRLQAQSIDLYCRDLGARSIYVIVNDSDSVAQQIDPAWWGSMSHLVQIVPRSMFSTEFVENGWVSQQILKILGASLSYNTWTVVLDAKTIFVKDILLSSIVDHQGRICVGRLPIYPVFETSRQIVNQLYNINISNQLGPGGVPFFFHNNTVRSMIAETSSQINQNFPLWFQQQGMLTEFILFSGFVYHKYGSFKQLYSAIQKIKPENICHSEVGLFDQKLSTAKSSTPNTISVHRNAWTQLTLDQQTQYREYLIGQGIIEAQNL
jgi:hypothetical protein